MSALKKEMEKLEVPRKTRQKDLRPGHTGSEGRAAVHVAVLKL